MNQKENWPNIFYLLVYKWRAVIVYSLIVTGIVSFLSSKYLQGNTYSSNTSVLILPKRVDGKQISSALSLEVYSELATSDVVLARTKSEIEKIGGIFENTKFVSHLNLTKYGRMGTSNISPIIKLEVQSKDATLLPKKVSIWGREFLGYIAELHFGMETDSDMYLKQQVAKLRCFVDSVDLVLEETNRTSKLDFLIKKSESLKKTLNSERQLFQKTSNEIATKMIEKDNATKMIKLIPKISKDGFKYTKLKHMEMLDRVRKLKIENQVSYNNIALKEKLKKLRNSRNVLVTYDFKKKSIKSRLEVLDSIMNIVPKTLVQKRELELIDSYAKKNKFVEASSNNTVYMQYKSRIIKAKEELLKLEKEKQQALVICSTYQPVIDSLSKLEMKRKLMGDIVERDLLLSKDRNNRYSFLVDSLTKRCDYLNFVINDKKMFLSKLDKRISSLESKYLRMQHNLNGLISKRDNLLVAKQRAQKNYDLLENTISVSKLENSMGMAHLKMLSDISSIVISSKDNTGKQVAVSIIGVMFLWFFIAFLYVGFMPDIEKAATKYKVGRFVRDVEMNKVEE